MRRSRSRRGDPAGEPPVGSTGPAAGTSDGPGPADDDRSAPPPPEPYLPPEPPAVYDPPEPYAPPEPPAVYDPPEPYRPPEPWPHGGEPVGPGYPPGHLAAVDHPANLEHGRRYGHHDPHRDGPPGPDRADHRYAAGAPDGPEGGPDPWDRPAESATVEVPVVAGRYDDQPGSRLSLPKMALIALVVGVLLIGVGALATLLPDDGPVALPNPPPTPEPTTVSPSPVPESVPTVPVSPATATPVDGGSLSSPTGGTRTTAPAPPRSTGPPESAVEPVRYAYEAEQARRGGLVLTVPSSGASGGRMVVLIGDSHVTFPVTVDRDGEYELTVSYSTTGDRTARLIVNDGEPRQIEFPALDGWGETGQVRVPVELSAGDNEIRLHNPDGPAPMFDEIVVTG